MKTHPKTWTFSIAFTAMKVLLTIFSVIFLGKVVHADEAQGAAVQLQAKLAMLSRANPDLLADVELFHKGVVWALRYDTPLTPNDDLLVKKALASKASAHIGPIW